MLWTLLGILLTASTVQAQAVSDADRFELFNACRPMRLVVKALASDAQEIGLTEEPIQLAAESRLRAARLFYTEPRLDDLSNETLLAEYERRQALSAPERAMEETNRAYYRAHLSINITIAGHAYIIHVLYWKWVTDLATNSNGPAIMWNTFDTGTHGRDAGFIIQRLSSLLDKFLAEYLRINESACN